LCELGRLSASVVGADVAPLDPSRFKKFIEAEVANWARLVKLAGIEPE